MSPTWLGTRSPTVIIIMCGAVVCRKIALLRLLEFLVSVDNWMTCAVTVDLRLTISPWLPRWGSNRGESIGWRKWAGRKKVLTMRWTVNGPRGRRRRGSLATVHSSDEEKGKPASTIPLHCQDQTTALARPPVPGFHCLGVSLSKVMEMLSSLQTEWSWICYTKKMIFL